MSKRTFLTNITPLPPTISRDVAVAMLHDHHGMIRLNPLVLRHEDSHPPSNASPDEYERAVWYEITDRINYLPGGAVKGEVSYKACFYNLPNGLQTHVFAPAGVDIRSKWSVGGNLPGEPREPSELGLDVPKDVLYIKEEVDLRCNVLMSNFVRRNLKKSHLVVAEKIVERAAQMGVLRGQQAQPLAKNFLTRETSIPTPYPSHTSNDPMADYHGPLHYSYPRHCACEGMSHKPTCTFFSPEDCDSQSVYEAIEQHKQKAFYAISDPSHPSLSDPPSVVSSPQQDIPCAELYGSVRQNSCLCTGGLHEQGCPSYPGLRLPQVPKLSLPDASKQTPMQATSSSYIDTSRSHELRQSEISIPREYCLQRPGEQAELSATRSPTSEERMDEDQILPSLQAGRES